MTRAGQDAHSPTVRAMVAEPATEYPQYPVAVAWLHELARDEPLVQLRRRTIAWRPSSPADQVVEKRWLRRACTPCTGPTSSFGAAAGDRAGLPSRADRTDRLGRVAWPHKS